MDSLTGNNHMLNNIADAYVFILNYENKRRGVDRKSRLFFSTECYLILCTEKYFKNTESQDDRKKALFKQMKKEMTNAEVTTSNNIQLVFFPVVLPGHYYLLCVNFLEGTLDVIDNRFLPPKIYFEDKYGDETTKMLKAFGEFYQEVDKKSDIVSSYETRNLNMKWKSNKNNHDCGVFLLKHMKTYEGQYGKQWNSGLEKDNFEQMKRLRVEYCWKIITSEINEERKRVMKIAKKWSKKNKIDI
ncbi:uncharacterized protein LOC110730561 isoform X3 [Chenopodium quinoa]|uniref:uncharacterized protein LOC110730561 isoform X3 n=1 Tax=Chenopodium quinoa TaxID=63459 RepID=UPI000B77C9AD|nr:uncharacterized protein LOC110730561 isoform X3 [Chenopodium quinoa]